MGAVVWALSPDPLWGLSPVTAEDLRGLEAQGLYTIPLKLNLAELFTVLSFSRVPSEVDLSQEVERLDDGVVQDLAQLGNGPAKLREACISIY